jgi:N4-gp56 family major capsid protein
MSANSNATRINELINPEVLADMVSAELEHAIVFAPLATVGTRLEGRAGNTITMPKFYYIGDAVEVGEGEDIPISKMEATSTSVTVKKAGKGVELTDEAVLNGYGDNVGEAKNQIVMSLANKIDKDMIVALRDEAQLTLSASSIDVGTLVHAKAKFGEKVNQPAVLLINSYNYVELASQILNRENTDKVLMDGVVGKVAGLQVVISDKLTDTEAYIVAAGALGLEYKRRVQVETDRDIIAKTTIITGDVHYATYLRDASKAIHITTSNPT